MAEAAPTRPACRGGIGHFHVRGPTCPQGRRSPATVRHSRSARCDQSGVAPASPQDGVTTRDGAVDPEKAQQLQTLIGNVAFTEGATHAFLTGAGMIWLGTVIVLLLMNAKADELATDEPPVGVH